MSPSNVQSEQYRSQYHFTPQANWINDPNGLLYYAGEYHLFYQYHPDSLVWGPMHWGHAVSTDLVHWEHLPTALYPDELGTIFSGSAVIDWHNSAGFGKEAMIAAFTYHLDDDSNADAQQSQGIAYSLDKGRTWTKYESNPVIPTVPGERDFRDPKVFWYVPEGAAAGDGYWVLLLAVDDSIWFYRSTDLKTWQKVSEFGEEHGSHAGVWETPDLFKLSIEGSNEYRWVLTIGLVKDAPAGGSGVHYFVGDFDGTNFTNENSPDLELWADYGADFYAAQGWNDAPNDQKLWIAWMNNWTYAREIPTPTWRGAMSLPRTLSLRHTAHGLRLVQRPVAQLQTLRDSEKSWQNISVEADAPNLLDDIQGDNLEIVATFDVSKSTAKRFGFRVRTGETEQTVIEVDAADHAIQVNRTNAGESDFNPAFPSVHTSSLSPGDDKIQLHLFIDRSSVEIFANDGLLTITEQIFPSDDSLGAELFVDEGDLWVDSLIVYQLQSIY